MLTARPPPARAAAQPSLHHRTPRISSKGQAAPAETGSASSVLGAANLPWAFDTCYASILLLIGVEDVLSNNMDACIVHHYLGI
jgi:hypothetical protein